MHTQNLGKIRRGSVAATSVTAFALGLAACGGSDAKGDPDHTASAAVAPTSTTAAASSARGPKLKLVSSDYGRILADGRGRALYLFTADRGTTSSCSGDCAVAWPPYIVKSKPTGISGAKPSLVGTTTTSDGKLQATYAGHPVYYYQGDNEPGEVLCQAVNEFGGYWYVLRSNGRAVR
jgi:predicted lipoprotein with Yx(FWY)xxD motif